MLNDKKCLEVESKIYTYSIYDYALYYDCWYVDYVLRDDFILDLRGIDYAGIGNRTP